MITSVPNLLTFSRILVIPGLVATFYFPGVMSDWIALGLFCAAGITDFLDGYVARLRGEMSTLGRFLDPVADKLLIVAAIVMLIAFDRIDGITVLAAVDHRVPGDSRFRACANSWPICMFRSP